MFIEHEAGELALFRKGDRFQQVYKKLLQVNTCYTAGAEITKGVNVDKNFSLKVLLFQIYNKNTIVY